MHSCSISVVLKLAGHHDSCSVTNSTSITKVKKESHYNTEDGQWSEGLVSAARLVAAATHNLCEAANSLVQGNSSEEKLIAAAKQVSAATAQLLVACKVKADPSSIAMKRLEAASNAVRRATDELVKAAQGAIERNEEEEMMKRK